MTQKAVRFWTGIGHRLSMEPVADRLDVDAGVADCGEMPAKGLHFSGRT